MNWNVFHLRSLNTKVTLFTLAIFVISIWSLTFCASGILRNDMQHLLGEQQFSVVTLIATDINEELGDRLRALEQLAEVVAPEIQGNRRGLQTILERHLHLQDMFSGGVIAIGIDGMTIADVPLSAGRIGVNYMDRDDVAAALRQGKSTIGRPVLGRKLHSPIVTMAAPVRDKQGKVIGAVAGAIDLGRPNFLDKIAKAVTASRAVFFWLRRSTTCSSPLRTKRASCDRFPPPASIRCTTSTRTASRAMGFL